MTTMLGGPITTEQLVEHNEGIVIGVALTQVVRSLLRHHRLDAAFVEQLTKTFARPAGFEQVEDTLVQHGIVVLLGERERGLHHAAVHLLGRRPGVRPLEVRLEPGAYVDPAGLPTDDRVGLLLDMRREVEVDPALGRGLADQAARLADRGSFVVVLGDTRTWSGARSGIEHLVHVLPTVAAVDIARRWIHVEREDLDVEPYLSHPRVQELLHNASPSEAVHWARDILRVAHMPDADVTEAAGDASYSATQRVQLVIAMRSSWRERLLDLHQRVESRERNFLLAAAVLEGAPAGVTFRAATTLAQALGEEAPAAAGQQGPGLIALCDVIDAELSSDDRLNFRAPGYAEAVIDYFWVDRQHLRDRFLRWLVDLPEQELDAPVAQAVAERVAPLILRRAVSKQSLTLLRETSSRWAANPHLRTQAAQLLLAASLDDDLGRDTRQAILVWARQQDSALKLVLTDVCSGDLADLRPREALYRLAALAESRDLAVFSAVSSALARLWHAKLKAEITRLVAQWCGPEQIEPMRLAGAAMFVILCRHVDDHGASEFIRVTSDDILSNGWNAVLETQPDAETLAALAPWLDEAVDAPDRQSRLVAVLASAVLGQGTTTGSRATRLAKVLFAWQPVENDPERPDRAALRDLLHNAALGQVPSVDTLPPPMAPGPERGDVESVATPAG